MMKMSKVAKCIISLLLVAAMSLTVAFAFIDDSNIKYIDEVKTFEQLGIISGYSDGSFAPNNSISLSEFAKIACTTAKVELTHREWIPGIKNHWANIYLNTLYEMGAISLNDKGAFNPDAQLTALEASRIMLGVFGVSIVRSTDQIASNPYIDRLLNKYTLDPNLPITREVAVLIAYNAMKLFESFKVVTGLDVMVSPNNIMMDNKGDLIITDEYYQTVWKGQDGKFNPIADIDGPYGVAKFLNGIAISDRSTDNIILLNGNNIQTINGITLSGNKMNWSLPSGLAADESGNLYVADTENGMIRCISSSGIVSVVANGLMYPTSICWMNNELYVVETEANRVVKIKDKQISVVAGNGTDGYRDGTVAESMLSIPQGIAVAKDGTVYIADTGNKCIRKVVNGSVTTIKFPIDDVLVSPVGLLVNNTDLYVCDNYTGTIYQIKL